MVFDQLGQILGQIRVVDLLHQSDYREGTVRLYVAHSDACCTLLHTQIYDAHSYMMQTQMHVAHSDYMLHTYKYVAHLQICCTLTNMLDTQIYVTYVPHIFYTNIFVTLSSGPFKNCTHQKLFSIPRGILLNSAKNVETRHLLKYCAGDPADY